MTRIETAIEMTHYFFFLKGWTLTKSALYVAERMNLSNDEYRDLIIEM